MKKVLIPGMLAAALALGVWYWHADSVSMPSTAVKDVRQAETLVIGKEGNPHTYAITVRGSGEIDGQATISLLLNGEPYKVASLSGGVNFEWGGDWYAETAEILYEPMNVRSGKVVLHYQFHRMTDE